MSLGGSIGVEDFVDDQEAIRAVRLFPGVMKSFAGLEKNASDEEVKAKFLPALKVMLPYGNGGWYFHDVLYNIEVVDADTITLTTGDMQVRLSLRYGRTGPY